MFAVVVAGDELGAKMTEAAQAEAGDWASTWTPTQYARNGTVRIAYDRLAGSEGEPLLLVMGLAVSRFWWPAGCARRSPARGSRWPATTSGTPGSQPGCRTPVAATRSPRWSASAAPTPPRT